MLKKHSSKFLDLKPALDPKLAALYGPIDLKVPGSEEWIIQLTARAVRVWMSLTDDTQEWREVVAKLDAQEVWRKYPPEKPYGTRDAFYRAELGAPEPMLTRMKEAQQLMAQGRALDAPRDKKGRYLSKESNGDHITFGRGTQAAYIRARLERDGKTELLGKIEQGEISAHSAAIEAGYRNRMISHRPTVEGFIAAAHAHLAPEQRLQLKEAL